MSHNVLALLSMPTEVLHSILREVDHPDLASLSLCCRFLHQFIKLDTLLWKQTYLASFVSPFRPMKLAIDSSHLARTNHLDTTTTWNWIGERRSKVSLHFKRSSNLQIHTSRYTSNQPSALGYPCRLIINSKEGKSHLDCRKNL